MQITIDTAIDSPAAIRHVAALLLSHIGDIPEGALDEPAAPEAPTPPPPPSAASDVPPPPPPPPPSVPAPIGQAVAAPTGTSAAPAAPAQATSSAATSLFDSAGLPWDARIHQQGKGTKKDGTWKLKKNIDQALVVQVVKELAAAKLGQQSLEVEVPAAPASVLLPPTATESTGGVPVPPSDTNAAPAAPVPAPDVPAPVPTVGSAAPGGVSDGVAAFRALVKKFGEATKPGGKLAPTVVAEICQQAGVPSLSALITMPQLLPTVEALLDARLMS